MKHATGGARIRNTVLVLCLGLILGWGAKIMDLRGGYLGVLFSELSVWYLLCIAISVRSASPLRAGLHVLLFCMGMLAAYYITAARTGAVWGTRFACGWTAFALCLPVCAYLTWFAPGKGLLPVLLRPGILAVMLLSQASQFGLGLMDYLLAAVAAWLLYHHGRRARQGNGCVEKRTC